MQSWSTQPESFQKFEGEKLKCEIKDYLGKLYLL